MKTFLTLAVLLTSAVSWGCPDFTGKYTEENFSNFEISVTQSGCESLSIEANGVSEEFVIDGMEKDYTGIIPTFDTVRSVMLTDRLLVLGSVKAEKDKFGVVSVFFEASGAMIWDLVVYEGGEVAQEQQFKWHKL